VPLGAGKSSPALAAGAELTVERAGREAVDREQPLQRRDVPAARIGVDHARAEPVAAPPAQRAARARPGDPVHDKSAPGLKPPHSFPRRRSADAVDRAAVQPLRAQRDLERGGAAAPGLRDGRKNPQRR
jgi:hypothetical protein